MSSVQQKNDGAERASVIAGGDRETRRKPDCMIAMLRQTIEDEARELMNVSDGLSAAAAMRGAPVQCANRGGWRRQTRCRTVQRPGGVDNRVRLTPGWRPRSSQPTAA